mmetsp:Transcript_6832/g.19710  ORF Transcript_6832/g.19710 Transcript_6832/m.19710 type:complete len:106 (-) Transcript_6832:225-542(-)
MGQQGRPLKQSSGLRRGFFDNKPRKAQSTSPAPRSATRKEDLSSISSSSPTKKPGPRLNIPADLVAGGDRDSAAAPAMLKVVNRDQQAATQVLCLLVGFTDCCAS